MKWQNVKHWIDVVLCIIAEIIYLSVWGKAFGKKDISEKLWNMVTPIARDSISAGITATSILLPATIAIMVLLLGKKYNNENMRDSIHELYLATLFFIISLGTAIFNFTHWPIKLTEDVHIAYDWVIGTLTITQFFSLALGTFKLFRGTYYLKKGTLEKI